MTLNLTVSSRLTLLTGLTALLAACGNTTVTITPTPKPTEVAGLIMGKITPFTAGDANSVAPDYLKISAPVSTTGQFDLGLPKASVMNTTYNSDLVAIKDVFGSCTDPQITAPADMEVFPINYLTTDKNQRIISEPTAGSTPFTYRGWWYSNKEATVKFKGTQCLLLGDTDTTLSFKLGWNLVLVSTDGNTATYTMSTQPTTHVAWQPFNTTKMASLGLSPNVLTPWRVLPQYRNR
ncbi:hypothetical protein E7T09_13130 [Deinococcus sp. KSM4-11]|uniref:hypothetical protein n=1 Tax=Deinococcus sp. KSM4-11 TaxID=2568654 RepID=UPI0010A47081|nr:hypothetical protein [Deinococcus sp. KSM4-11]THF86162.1 hypothetical protein E7T09_13130 [Deinococcus sp. KSM4-11]